MANTTIPSELIADGAITSAKLDTNIAVGGTLNVSGAFTSLGIDDNANATAITIDSDENVLVGLTAPITNVNTTVDGVTFGKTYTWTHVSNAGGQYVQRQNDGNFSTFYRSTTNAGSIGTIAGYMTVGTSDTGVVFHSGEDNIQPWNVSTNTGRDNAISLGVHNGRFKDLYLSGGVYLGGTGAANKLDDYEEGTWTPLIDAASGTQPSISYAHNTGSYTKVGRLVTLIGYIRISSISGTTSGNLNINGLPFPQTGGDGYAACGSFAHSGLNFVNTQFGSISQYITTNIGFLTSTNNAAWTWEKVSILSANDELRFSYTYSTDA